MDLSAPCLGRTALVLLPWRWCMCLAAPNDPEGRLWLAHFWDLERQCSLECLVLDLMQQGIYRKGMMVTATCLGVPPRQTEKLRAMPPEYN